LEEDFMKKLLYIMMIFLAVFAFGCEDDEGFVSLKVKVNYEGTDPDFGDTDPEEGRAGTANIYALIWASDTDLTDAKVSADYQGSTATNDSVIKIMDMAPGEYKVCAFYDYRTHKVIPGKGDPYEFYSELNGTPYVVDAGIVTITDGETKEIEIIFPEDGILYKVGDKAKFKDKG